MVADRELEEKGKRELLFNGYKVSVIQDEQILEMYNCVPVVSSTVPLRLKICQKGRSYVVFSP